MSKNTLRHWGYTQCPECEGRGDWTDDPTPGAYRERCTTCYGTGRVPRELPEGYWVEIRKYRNEAPYFVLRCTDKHNRGDVAERKVGVDWGQIDITINVVKHWPAIRQFFDTPPDEEVKDE